MNPPPPPYDPNQPQGQPHYDPNQAQLDAAETRSKFAALGMALLVHGLIFALLAWIVLDVMNDEAPELIVESAQGDSDIPIVKKEFMQNMQQKPSAAASAPAVAGWASRVA
jgi:hypothetical protein